MNIVIYALLALGATTIGSLSGMGGGVIMKPAMDFLGHYSSASIGLLSSLTVFFMSSVSLAKDYRAQRASGRVPVSISRLLILSAGSVAGGIAGQFAYEWVRKAVNNNDAVIFIQNICLLILMVAVFIYMLFADKIKKHGFSSAPAYILSGFVLGFISSFLGIGGGPINVALFIYVFSFEIKTAAFASLTTIFFAQIAKLASVLLTTGFAPYDLSMAPYMIACGVAGGFLGTHLKLHASTRAVNILFNITEAGIIALCVANIVRSL
ncbi:sulfite exporter TauE/SafE family protein [Treponema sp. HNW]|uniref:sulfite exporter TauE/SafE family protein n=1 Tax=Treponema sp. HNW TaxID=3116654 RepID=UPI003D0EDC36